MEDVLQGCGDACGSFCTAYYFCWTLGRRQLLPCPPPSSNDAPARMGHVMSSTTRHATIMFPIMPFVIYRCSTAGSVDVLRDTWFGLASAREVQRVEEDNAPACLSGTIHPFKFQCSGSIVLTARGTHAHTHSV